jgi:hypothetical protein
MAVIKQDIDIAEVMKWGVVAYGCYVAYGLFKSDKSKDGNSAQAPPVPDGFKVGPNATITLKQGQQIAGQIKTLLNTYFKTIDVQKIDRLMWVLQNDDDVEVLYSAFGTWDGPLNNNGDLLAVLQYINSWDVITNASQANWDSIKAHLYSRGVYLNY